MQVPNLIRKIPVLLLLMAGPAFGQASEAPEASDESDGQEGAPAEASEQGQGEPSSEPPSVAAEDIAPIQDYGTDLRTLEEQVNALKERVFKSKARLVLLRETVLNGVISGARARIIHRNEMGPSFVLERVSYTLDGEPLFNRSDDTGSLDGETELSLFEGSIVPGTHSLSVLLVYRGNGYGVFTYLQDYIFKIRASFPFTAEEGKLVTIKSVGYEKGGITTDLQNRPTIRFESEVKKDARIVTNDEGLGATP